MCYPTVAMAASLGSFRQSPREGEEKLEEMGFLTMEDFKGVNFEDDFHQSMGSLDRLMMALGFLIEKDDRLKKIDKKEDHQIKKVRFYLGPSNSNTIHPLTPGLVHGQYFNVAFDEKKQQNYNGGGKRFAPPNWVLQGCPKKPRSTPHPIGASDAILDDVVHSMCLKRKDSDGHFEAPKRKKKKMTAKSSNEGTHINLSLPDEYTKLIVEMMNGADLKLLIEKELSTSDVNPNLNRLLLPTSKVSSDNFLMPNEIETLDQGISKIDHDQGCLQIPFIDTRLKLEDNNRIILTRWKLTNSERRTYVLKKTWNEVVKKNNLIEGDVIQIWSFRGHSNRLHLAITVVKRAERAGRGKSSTSDAVGGGDACGSTIQSTSASIDGRREQQKK